MKVKLRSLIIFLFYSVQIVCQSDNYQQFNFTIDDGLPSNESHDIVQDSLGYIWIATDRGLSRYDGYGFKNYGKKEGLEDLSCLQLFIDHNQTMWIRTYSNRIFKYTPDLDQITPYEFNDKIRSYNKNLVHIDDIYFDKNDIGYFVLKGLGLLRIESNGALKLMNTETYIHKVHNEVIEIDDKLFGLKCGFLMAEENIRYEEFNGSEEILENLLIHDTIYYLNYNESFSVTSKLLAFKISDTQHLVSNKGVVYLFENERLKANKFCKGLLDLNINDDGQISTVNLYKEGFKLYKDVDAFMSDKYINLLPNVSTSNIFTDHKNNYWVSSLEKGVYFFKKNNIEILDLGTHTNSKILDIELYNDQQLYLNVDKHRLIQLNLKNNESNEIFTLQSELTDIKYIPKNKSLIYATSEGVFTFRNSISKPLIKKRYCSKIETLQSNTKADNVKLAFLSSERYIVHSINNEEENYYSEVEDKSMRIRSIVEFDESKNLLGTIDGLYFDENQSFSKVDIMQNDLNVRINSISKMDDYFVLGTQGLGLIFWDGTTNIKQVSTLDGLISNNIENIIIRDDHIYVSTYSGLSILEYKSNNDYFIKNLSIFNGLPSQEIFDVELIDDFVYVATGRGLVKIPEYEEVSFQEKPIFELIKVNDNNFTLSQFPGKLDYTDNSVMIHFKSLNLPMQGNILYRYKIGLQNWTETNSTFINFVSLAPGDHKFVVQSKDNSGTWSKSSILSFTIKAPWWETIWFYLLCFVLFIIILFKYLSYKENRFQEQAAIQEEIRDLEKSALMAQMNPHFIFNCLNSIQNFIMNNDKEQAMSYLSHFAKLIRQNLNASNESSIALVQEIDMLENYLKLEKLRFKERFDYKIIVDPSINMVAINIPPLLIQPYVENAVIHGMEHKEKDGLIQLTFRKEGDKVLVIVEDNGGGYNGKLSNSTHKSMGISITNKRLAYINNIQSDRYKTVSQSSENGTKVSIFIKADQDF